VRAGSGEIRLDGILDETAWQSAAVIPDLAQQAPRPGEPTPFRTVVRVLADSRNLYFGVTCSDPDPTRIAVHTMQRDGSMKGDDTVSIVLDTFHDRRTGYLFEVNAAGARLDGLISDPNVSDVPLDWDGIWDVRTSVSAEGWVAEIVIPESRSATGRAIARLVEPLGSTVITAANTDYDAGTSLAELIAYEGKRFEAADTNHDGRITVDEMPRGLAGDEPAAAAPAAPVAVRTGG